MTKKSYAKINVFLKIAGKRGEYHELVSRFVRVKDLYDDIYFKDEKCTEFTLEGRFGCETKKNTIYKAYIKLCEFSFKVEDFFNKHKVIVEKNIPEFAGLGGGSSNCATFILMVNEVCKLKLTKDEMASIGATIGADVPFFIYEYDSANVIGIGEIVERFDEELFNIEIITPKIECDTGAIFREFRNKFYKEITKEDTTKLLVMKSCDIVKNLSIEEANDLYLPASSVEEELRVFAKDGWFFSGSGSSFFRLKCVG
ncbi:MAG: 4-(cytidine 5'-diphospho)-2-C-methyl-D-erythritol kinase [Epsilonproteobacteria bacterium]|nr:4-(cytidine 5'-diphospho)-2-C-methyl-D-erythritol kinase [Campylobacterota bacterium]